MSHTILAKSARGSAYNIVVSALTIVLGLTRSVLLMHLLLPEQFGMMTLGLFLMSFLAPLSNFGIDSALVQRETLSDKALSTHFVLRVGLALALLLGGVLLSPLLRVLYANQQAVVNIFLMLLISNLFEATFSTQGVILRRELRFGVIALLNLLASLAMTITAPLLAYLGAGMWSLVAEQVIGPLVRGIALWFVLHPWKVSLGFDREEAQKLFLFGRHIFSSNMLGILLDRFDDFWIGTTLGATPLGYYSRAYDIAQYPERVLATPITNVFFATYALLQNDKKALSQAFFRSSSFLVRAGFLLAAILITAAPEITLVLFGETWLPLVPVLRLMLIYIIMNPFYANLSYLMIGIGKPNILNRIRVMQVLSFVILVIITAAYWNINGVAMAANIMMLYGVILLTVYSRRYTQYSLIRLFLWPIISAGMAMLVGGSIHLLLDLADLWTVLIFKVIVIATIYLIILYFTERDVMQGLLKQIWIALTTNFHWHDARNGRD